MIFLVDQLDAARWRRALPLRATKKPGGLMQHVAGQTAADP